MSKESAEKIIKDKLLDYLKLKKIKLKKNGKVYTFECPFCHQTATTIPCNKHEANCMSGCNKYYNVLDFARKLDNLEDKEDKDVYQFLKSLMKLDVTTSKELENILDYLKFYEKNGFDLVPIMRNKKRPIEKDWVNKSHKDRIEWQDWLDNDLNIGVKTGIRSNITILDFDVLTKKEKDEYNTTNDETKRQEFLKLRKERLDKIFTKYKDILNDTLRQDSIGGCHLIYKYEPNLPKTGLQLDNIKIDLENDGGQVVLYPSIVKGKKRKIVKITTINKMSSGLKELLKKKVKTVTKTDSEEIREAIKEENFKINPKDFQLKNDNLEGCCNNSFIKLGGILRKQLNIKETSYALHVLNKHLLADPMPTKDIQAMLREINKYQIFDEEELAEKILEYLNDIEEASRNEIANAIVGTNRGEDKKRIDKTLTYLAREGKIYKDKTKYAIRKTIDWKTNLINVGVPIDYKMPYFYDIMNFNKGDLVLIGSRNSVGKTHIAINIVKQLVEQGINPYYVSLETGSRWAQIALKLGLKEGDFRWYETAKPTEIELHPNSFTVIDWLCPQNYAEVDKLLQHFADKIQNKSGNLIIFMQLRDNNEWLAKDLVKQFPALVSRYIYDNEDDGEYGYFYIDKLRDSKTKQKFAKIPCQYDWETKILKRIDEIEKEERHETQNND